MFKFFKKLFKSKTPTGVNDKSAATNSIITAGLDDTFLFDFKNYGSMYNGHGNSIMVSGAILNVNGTRKLSYSASFKFQ